MRPARLRAVAPVAVALAVAVLPAPEGLSRNAWWFFALFAGTVTALVLEPVPAAAAGLCSVSLAAALRLVDPSPAASARWGLSGFGNATVWLIFSAFVLALGYERSGLGRRLALLLVRAIGRRPFGLGYAVALSDFVLAPLTPSNTARSAGTLFPVIRQIPEQAAPGSPEDQRRLGGYLAWTAFAVTCITSSMFLTALAPNLLAVEVVRTTTGVRLEWTSWLLGFWPVGLALAAVTPLAGYAFFRPAQGTSEAGAAVWAATQLREMGGITRRETKVALLALLALTGWVAGRELLDATTVALLVVGLMVLTGAVRWDEVLGHAAAWNVLVWFATLVALADGLARVGFVSWIAKSATVPLAGLSPTAAALLLLTLFFASHYLFASVTAHVAALLPVALATAAALPGIDAARFAALLCYSLGLMGVISPYATGPAPAYYASGFLSRGQFWGLGFAFGSVFLLALLALAAITL